MNGIQILSPALHQEVITLVPGQFGLAFDCRAHQTEPYVVPPGKPTLRRESSLWMILQKGAVLDNTSGLQDGTGIFKLSYSQTVRVGLGVPAFDGTARSGEGSPAELLPLILDPRNFSIELQTSLRPMFLDCVRTAPPHLDALHYLDTLLDIEPTYFAEIRADYERRATQARNMLSMVEADLSKLITPWVPLFNGLLEARFAVEQVEIKPDIDRRFRDMDLKVESAVRENFAMEKQRSEMARANLMLIAEMASRLQTRSDHLPQLIEEINKHLAPPTGPVHRRNVTYRRTGPPSHGTPPSGLSWAIAPGNQTALPQAMALPPAAQLAVQGLGRALSSGEAVPVALENAVRAICVNTRGGKALDEPARLAQLQAWLQMNGDDGRDPISHFEEFLQHLSDSGCVLTPPQTKTAS